MCPRRRGKASADLGQLGPRVRPRGPRGANYYARVHRSLRRVRMVTKARQCGYELEKSQRRDPAAVDYGLYALCDPQTGGTVNPSLAGRYIHSWHLDDVESWLNNDD